MTNIVNFPQKEKRPSPMPRQRVFYIGFRYVGQIHPMTQMTRMTANP